jgi:hypothetical protein
MLAANRLRLRKIFAPPSGFPKISAALPCPESAQALKAPFQALMEAAEFRGFFPARIPTGFCLRSGTSVPTRASSWQLLKSTFFSWL